MLKFTAKLIAVELHMLHSQLEFTAAIIALTAEVHGKIIAPHVALTA